LFSGIKPTDRRALTNALRSVEGEDDLWLFDFEAARRAWNDVTPRGLPPMLSKMLSAGVTFLDTVV